MEAGYIVIRVIDLSLPTKPENSLNYNWKVEVLNLRSVIHRGEGAVSVGLC